MKTIKYTSRQILYLRLFAINDYKNIIIYKGDTIRIKFEGQYIDKFICFYCREKASIYCSIFLSNNDFDFFERQKR